jgi:hypothetical protein
MLNFSAWFSVMRAIICATVERFWPMATYTQMRCFFLSGFSLICFWLIIVSMAMAVLPVWRSPMMSSRWPRPMGINASTALRPVCMGSCTDLRCRIPGACTARRGRVSRRNRRRRGDQVCARKGPHLDFHAVAAHGLHRALAVDGLPERVHGAAQQPVAHGHVHDGARALHHVALEDLAVRPEDDHAHVVVLQVQRHALDACVEGGRREPAGRRRSARGAYQT